MYILPQLRQQMQARVLPLVPKKWQPMVVLGVNTISLSPFRSLNSNARGANKTAAAAMMQLYRLVHHAGIQGLFPKLVTSLVSITNDSVIAMDFSKFGDFYVLCFAVQTQDGRAIPVWLDAIEYPVQEDSQNIFILKVVKEFLTTVGCTPKLVCDRGFIGEYLINGFRDLGVLFYVRMKQGKTILVASQKQPLSTMRLLELTGTMYNQQIRVVRSSKTLQRQRKAKEPWYIITNDTTAERAQILCWYAHRFEIEEVFKDLKHLFDTVPRYITRRQTITILLWLQLLGFWLMWTIPTTKTFLKERLKHHKKKLLSWVRFIFEQISKERTRPIIPVSCYGKEVY